MHSNCSKMFNLLLANKYFGCLTEKWERYGELRNRWRISICGAERLSIRIGGWLGQMRVPICDPNNSLFRKLIINFGLPRLATAGTQDMKAGEPRRILLLLSTINHGLRIFICTKQWTFTINCHCPIVNVQLEV